MGDAEDPSFPATAEITSIVAGALQAVKSSFLKSDSASPRTGTPEPTPQKAHSLSLRDTVTFYDVHSPEEVAIQVEALGYTLHREGDLTSCIKYKVKWATKAIGVLTSEPAKSKWVIQVSQSNATFISNLREAVAGQQEKWQVEISDGFTKIRSPPYGNYKEHVALIRGVIEPLSVGEALAAKGGTGQDTKDERFLVNLGDPVDGRLVAVTVNAGEKAKKVREGYVLSMGEKSEESFQLIDKIDVGGKLTDVVYQFQKESK